MADILEIAKEGTLKTQIMYKANLSFTQLSDYLSFMLNNNFCLPDGLFFDIAAILSAR